MSISLSHLGLCGSGLECSLRFYCDGLGFERGPGLEVGSQFAATLEVTGEVEVTSQYVGRDGLTSEFLFVADPDGVRIERLKLAG
jgi:hypothetical protein